MHDPQVQFTADILGREGITPSALAASCRRGERQRLRRGAYLPPADLDERTRHRRLIQATWPMVHPESAVSHMSAAVLHEMPVVGRYLDRVWITRTGPGNGRIGRYLHLRNCHLDAGEAVAHGDMRVTSLARTAADLARELPFGWAVAECDAALARGCPADELSEVVERGRRRPGNSKARRAASFADARAESPLESLSRVTIAMLGFPAPVLQLQIFDGTRFVARSDFGWPEYGLIGEVDGAAKYGRLLHPGQTPQEAVLAEKRREDDVRGLGWWVVRWGAREASDPALLEPILRRGFEMARTSRR